MNMVLQAIPGIRIAGSANAWPEELLGEEAQLSNEQIYECFLGRDWRAALAQRGWRVERPKQEFGVEKRGWTKGSHVTCLELSVLAAEKALQQAGVAAEDVQCLFSATCTPFQISSTLAGKIARQLRTDAAAMDIRAGGGGGLNSLATAALYHSHGCKVSLVVAAEVSSHYVSPNDLANGLLFGDGASAMVLVSDSSCESAGLTGALMSTAPWQGHPFTIPGRLPPTDEYHDEDYLFQAPDDTYRTCLAEAWGQTTQYFREVFSPQCESLTAMLPYAINRPQVLAAVESFNAPCDAALKLLQEHGCIGCASPLAAMVQHMEDEREAGNTLSGQVLGSIAVGGGISCSGLLWQL